MSISKALFLISVNILDALGPKPSSLALYASLIVSVTSLSAVIPEEFVLVNHPPLLVQTQPQSGTPTEVQNPRRSPEPQTESRTPEGVY